MAIFWGKICCFSIFATFWDKKGQKMTENWKIKNLFEMILDFNYGKMLLAKFSGQWSIISRQPFGVERKESPLLGLQHHKMGDFLNPSFPITFTFATSHHFPSFPVNSVNILSPSFPVNSWEMTGYWRDIDGKCGEWRGIDGTLTVNDGKRREMTGFGVGGPITIKRIINKKVEFSDIPLIYFV